MVSFASDAEGAGESVSHQLLREVLALRGDDEGIDSREIRIATGIGSRGVDGERLLQCLLDESGGFFAKGFCDGRGLLRIGIDVGDAEVAALGAETAAVGGVGHVPLDAIGSIQPDTDGLAVGWFDEETVAIRPGGFFQRAALVRLQWFLRQQRSGESDQAEEQTFHGGDVILGRADE